MPILDVDHPIQVSHSPSATNTITIFHDPVTYNSSRREVAGL